MTQGSTETNDVLQIPDTALVKPGEVVGVTNQKGGAGKTSTTVGLAGALVEQGVRVRMLDADPQKASLSTWLAPDFGDRPPMQQFDLGHVYMGECTLDEATYPTRVPGLDLVPSYKSLTQFEHHPEVIGKDLLLQRALKKSKNEYDITLIDHAPSLQQNALTSLIACNAVIIPVNASGLDMDGVSDLNETLQVVQEMFNPDQRIVSVLISQSQSNNLTNDTAEVLQDDYPEAYFTRIRYTVRVREAQVARELLTEFSPNSTATQDYATLVTGVFAPVIQAAKERRG